jgi:hypothetical protein
MSDFLIMILTVLAGFFTGRATASVPLAKVPAAVARIPGHAASHVIAQAGTDILQWIEHLLLGASLLALAVAILLVTRRHRPHRN